MTRQTQLGRQLSENVPRIRGCPQCVGSYYIRLSANLLNRPRRVGRDLVHFVCSFGAGNLHILLNGRRFAVNETLHIAELSGKLGLSLSQISLELLRHPHAGRLNSYQRFVYIGAKFRFSSRLVLAYHGFELPSQFIHARFVHSLHFSRHLVELGNRGRNAACRFVHRR